MTRLIKKPEERRHDIVMASKELFLEKDYESTTIQDVMQKLNIAKGTTYHYFKSKAELLDAVVSEMVEQYWLGVQAALKECSGNALEKIRVLIQAGCVKDEQEATLEALHRPGNSILHTKLLAETLSRLAPLYKDLIVQGCQEGLFQTEEPLECAEWIIAATQFLTDVGIYPWSEEVLIRRKKAVPRLIEQLLRAPKRSFEQMIPSW